MKQLQITRHGGPEVLQLVETPTLPLGSHDVRIQVKAAGVNFADLMMRMGLYPEAPKTPFTPGYEIAGRVIEVGPKVQFFKAGDRVLAGTKFGGYTSEIVLPEYLVKKTPDCLSDEEAAGVVVNFLTAWIALHEMGRVRAGDRVVIPSAAGGVGTAAVQIAVQAGAHVIGLVSSPDSKKEQVLALGAQEVLSYNEWNQLERSTAHIILNSIGGKSIKEDFKKLLPTGRIITYGASSTVSGKKRSLLNLIAFATQTPFFTPFQLMFQNKGVFGLNLLQFFDDFHSDHHPAISILLSSLDKILDHIDKKNFRVILGKSFALEAGGEAHTWLQSRSNIGKVVLIPDN